MTQLIEMLGVLELFLWGKRDTGRDPRMNLGPFSRGGEGKMTKKTKEFLMTKIDHIFFSKWLKNSRLWLPVLIS